MVGGTAQTVSAEDWNGQKKNQKSLFTKKQRPPMICQKARRSATGQKIN
jgi:hypothetical protein